VRNVWYLCHSAEDPPGMVFPSELPDHYYSPGVFYIEWDGRSEEPYRFRHRQQGQDSASVLLYQGNGLFSVPDSPVGRFWFFAEKPHYKFRKYIGASQALSQHGSFWRLFELWPDRHELACREQDFYFLGSIE
jgi:hypothetical protein